MAEIELLDKSFKLIRDGLIFGEVIHKEHVESFLQENERKINELQTEIERLKGELQQSETKCNNLRCLALNLFWRYAWVRSIINFSGSNECDHRCEWRNIADKMIEAWRKAKKALREGK